MADERDPLVRIRPDGVHELYPIPDDLERWGWAIQSGKSGPRKHPGAWFQMIFWREHGLATGDEQIPPGDELLRVKVRRPSIEEVWADALAEMRQKSRSLRPSAEYELLIGLRRERQELTRRAAEMNRRAARGSDPEAEAWLRTLDEQIAANNVALRDADAENDDGAVARGS